MASPIFTLHAAREDLHDRIAGRPGDFVNVVRELRDATARGDDFRVRVPVHYRSFGLLDRTLRVAAELSGTALDLDGVRFAPPDNESLAVEVDRHLAALAGRLAGTRIALEVRREDPLFEIVGRLRGAVGFESDADVLRLFGALTGGAYVGPRVFHVDVSNRCNTDCVYCWFHSEFSSGREDIDRLDARWREEQLDFDLYARLIDDLAELRTTEDLVLSGKGEPLTHPRALDMVRLAKTRGMAVTLFTNGILLSVDAARALVDARTDLLYVSLSACNAASYRRLHQNPPAGEFERIAANCRRLAAIKRAAGTRFPELVLVSILTNRNAAEVIPFARLAADLGADRLRYQLAAIEPYNEPLRLSAEAMARLREDLPEARRIAEAAGIRVIENISFQLAHAPDGSHDWSGDYFRRRGCYAGWLFSRVWADGQVSFCCVPKPLGDLRESSFAALWRSDAYQALRLDAKWIAEHGDARLRDGSTLWDARCLRCPNYEQIQWLFDLAERLHVAEWLG